MISAKNPTTNALKIVDFFLGPKITNEKDKADSGDTKFANAKAPADNILLFLRKKYKNNKIAKSWSE